MPRYRKPTILFAVAAVVAAGLTGVTADSARAEPNRAVPATVAMADRGPFPATDANLRALPGQDTEPQRPDTEGAREAACDVADFTSRTGAELAQFVRDSDTDCVNTLFGLSGDDAHGAFREEQMVSVAEGFADNAVAYPGDNSTGTAPLVLYLRAGYYVQWGDPDAVGEYGPRLDTAIRTALDAFFDNPNSGRVSDANGETLAEAVTLVDSAEQNARYIYVVERMLDSYTSEYDQYWWMLNAVNNSYYILFRGHQVPEFVDAVTRDPSVLDTVHDFAASHLDLLEGDNRFLVSNAGRELARFLQHEPLHATVRPLARDLLDRTDITGPTASLWVGVAEMTDYYDRANCSYYDTCDLAQRLRDAVLPVSHDCGGGRQIVAQELSADELSQSCDSLAGQDGFFHDLVRDPGPVADDHNDSIEIVVFDSSADYQTYAGAIFGIDTNNGGMYLEGDPSDPDNLPRFIAYEAEWQRPDFAIWNLNHEYTHYLDGRYNMYGDFAENMSTPTVWWIEGFAEYVSYSYRDLEYTEAIAEAGKATYGLDTLFSTTYDADTTRVYRWGYLAVRYMIQYHPDDVDKVLSDYRRGDWDAAYAHLTGTIGSGYNDDWYRWLSDCAAGDCG